MPLLYRDPIFQEHDTGRHPENAGRLRAIDQRLAAGDVTQLYQAGQPRAATEKELGRIHSIEHIRYLQGLDEHGGGRIDGDTRMSPRSWEAATHAAGCAIDAVDRVLSGDHTKAACLVRPPGHHATPNRAMGFCLFNNVAVAAAHATQHHGLRRVLIVDWDVHHGNGTQDCFYDEEHVYFMSSHRDPFYPGTGARSETGTGAGLGTIFNLPCTFGISRERFLAAFEKRLHAAAEKCLPELVLISAGFDAHRSDPIGSLGLECEDFAALTTKVVDVANTHARGRVVSFLEGGYNPDALAESVEIHLRTLAEDA